MSMPGTDRGLQRERTSMSWTRTALAMIANGLLVLVRHEGSFPQGVAIGLSVLWLGLALVVLWYAGHRGRLVEIPDHEIGSAARFVVPLTVIVAALCAATAVAISLT